MLKYLSYMQSISVNRLVSKIDEVGMCLSDWLTSNDIQLPPAFVPVRQRGACCPTYDGLSASRLWLVERPGRHNYVGILGDISRLRNHPMFGASVAYIFQYILGIRQEKEEFGHKRIIINPAVPHLISNVQGHVTVPISKIYVSVKDGALNVSLPKEIVAEIVFDGPVSVDYT